MWPSNEAVARRSGLRGHQVVWNDQSLLGGSFCQRVRGRWGLTSPMISPVCGFQQRVRLSLPQDKSRSASCLHQDTDRTPF